MTTKITDATIEPFEVKERPVDGLTVHEYHGHRIELRKSRSTVMRWHVSGPDVENWETASFEEAVGKIDAARKLQEKATKTKVALPMLDSKGKHVTVTGIHAKNGDLLPASADGGGGYRSFYPRVAWVEETLLKMDKLGEELAALRYLVRPFLIQDHRTGRMNAENYDIQIERLKVEHAQKTAEAEKKGMEFKR